MLSGVTVFAQRRTYSKAPDAVRVAFNKQFQRVDDPRWVIEDGKYEAVSGTTGSRCRHCMRKMALG